MRTLLLLSTAAAVLAASACGDAGSSPTAAPEGLTADEAASIAPQWDDLGGAVVDGLSGAFVTQASSSDGPRLAVTVTTEFSRTRTCPEGGSVTVAGTNVVTHDRETRSATFATTATRTEAACAFRGRRGATLTITGNPNTALTANASVADGVPGKRTMTQKGAFTWSRSTGESGACTVDITSEWDPATKTHTVAGTFCNRTVNVTRTRT